MNNSNDRTGRILLFSFDFLAGCFKISVILAALLLPPSLLLGGGDCRGDCATGVALLFIAIISAFGGLLLMLGLPFVGWILHRWTRGRPVQFIGGLIFIPMLAGVWSSYTYVRDAILSSKIEAAIRPEYLDRTIAKPVGKLPHLVLVGTGGFCLEYCYEVLVNAIASKYSHGYFSTNGESQDILERVYRLGSGDDCFTKTETTSSSIEYLQQQGIFDACVLDAKADQPLTATVLRGFNYDDNVLVRPDGLRGVMVIQTVNGGMLGPELLRWEYGSLPGTRKPIGTPFEWQDLIRAHTGISTDRFSEAEKLGHSQRVERVFLSKSSFLRFHPVFYYLRQAPDSHRFRSFEANPNPQKMSSDGIAKLKAVGDRICTATPVVKRDEYGAKSEDCITAYNQFVRANYPEQADALILAAR